MFPTEGRVLAVSGAPRPDVSWLEFSWLEFLEDRTTTLCTAGVSMNAVRPMRRTLGACGRPIKLFRITRGRYRGFRACLCEWKLVLIASPVDAANDQEVLFGFHGLALDVREVQDGLHVLVDGAILHITLDHRLYDFTRVPCSSLLASAKFVAHCDASLISMGRSFYIMDAYGHMTSILVTYALSEGCVNQGGDLLAFRADSVVKAVVSSCPVQEVCVYRVNQDQGDQDDIKGVSWLDDESFAVVFKQRVEICISQVNSNE